MTELTTEIEINARAEKVWKVLMDFEAYPEWNRFVREISGKAKVGATLSVYIKPEGGTGAKLAPAVVEVSENKLFAWKGKLGIRGIFDGRHEFQIEPIADDKVRFIQREEFSGILVPVLWPMLRKNTQRGFEDMNRALKERAESN